MCLSLQISFHNDGMLSNRMVQVAVGMSVMAVEPKENYNLQERMIDCRFLHVKSESKIFAAMPLIRFVMGWKKLDKSQYDMALVISPNS